MFKLQDLNPLFKQPQALFNNSQCASTQHQVPPPNSSSVGIGNPIGTNQRPQSTNSYGLNGSNYGNNPSQSHDAPLTLTNYYKFTSVSKINAYFYQVQEAPATTMATTTVPTMNNDDQSISSSGASAGTSAAPTTNNSEEKPSPLQQIHSYDILIKDKLMKDYNIKDVMSFVAKKEVCVFQIEIHSASDNQDSGNSEVGFNQLKDAIDNIIIENKMCLKLVSASRFNADSVFKQNVHNQQQVPTGLQKRPINIIYLSFLRAVKKYLSLKLTNTHVLDEASLVEVLPFGSQLLSSGVLNVGNGKKHKKISSYSVIKTSPSLNLRNELMISITLSKYPSFYKLPQVANSIQERKDFVVYLVPSGVRCMPFKSSIADSLATENPQNYESLIALLQEHLNIRLSMTTKWIKLIPNLNHMNGLTPTISKYLEAATNTNSKYIVWPVDLCFVQFAVNATDVLSPQDPNIVKKEDLFEVSDPYDLVFDFIEGDEKFEKEQELEAQKAQAQTDAAAAASAAVATVANNKTQGSPNDLNAMSPSVIIPSPGTLNNSLKDWVTGDMLTQGINSIDNQLLQPSTENGYNLPDIKEEKNEQEEIKQQQQQHEVLATPMIAQSIGGESKHQIRHSSEESESVGSGAGTGAIGDGDWDELFGDMDEDEEDENRDSDRDSEIGNANANVGQIEKIEGQHEQSQQPSQTLEVPKPETREEEIESLESTSTSPKIELQAVPQTNPLYEDPGAPFPGTFQIFASPSPADVDETRSRSVATTSPDLSNGSINASGTNSGSLPTPKDRRKSIFAPLNFNPLIEKDIDSKYSTGGKFFVKGNACSVGSANGNQIIDNNPLHKNQPPSATSTSFMESISDTMSMSGLASLTTPTFLRKRNYEEAIADYDDDLISDSEDDDDKNYNGEGDDDEESEIEDNGEEEDDDEEEEEKEEEDDKDDKSDSYEIANNDNLGLGLTKKVGLPALGIKNNTDLFGTPAPLNVVSPATGISSPLPITTPTLTATSINSNEIQNWLFWILRGPPLSTIPSRFLANERPKILKRCLASVLPILQELILYSDFQDPKKNRDTLHILNESREGPTMIGNDFECVLNRIFPGVHKLNLSALLEPIKETEPAKPFDCLFASPASTSPPSGATSGNSGKSRLEMSSKPRTYSSNLFREYDDPSFATTSPLFNINSNPPDNDYGKRSSVHISPSKEKKTNKDTLNNISANSLFRMPTTIVNSKRMNEPLKISQSSLPFWKYLDLEPLSDAKDFRILFIIPKSYDSMKEKAIRFLECLMVNYNSCKLGTIEFANTNGLVEVEVSSFEKYWDKVKYMLGRLILKMQDTPNEKPVLLLFASPFDDLNTVLEMSSVGDYFNTKLNVKTVQEPVPVDDEKKKKKKKSVVQTKQFLNISVFYKAISIDKLFPKNGDISIFTNEQITRLSLSLYNICPSQSSSSSSVALKDRAPIVTVSKDLPKRIFFMLTKQPIAKNLINDELFLHVCYERSIDKKWCVASWTDQYGSIGFTKTWYVGDDSKTSKSFEDVSNQIMEVTLQYVLAHNGKSYVILTRLTNVIPDDELTEWKRLSMKNNKLTLIVLTVEIESSTLVLSNKIKKVMRNRKDDLKEFYSVKYTVGSTNSQAVNTPNMINNHGSVSMTTQPRFDPSPEINVQTPSYDMITSPNDPNTSGTPGQSSENQFNFGSPSIIDIAKECYGVIFHVAQPLSNQPIRIPLRTGFLINSSNKNKILEVNLLSCQSGVNSNEWLKKLLHQFKNLSVLSEYYYGYHKSDSNEELPDVEFDMGYGDDDEIEEEDDEERREKNVQFGYFNEAGDEVQEVYDGSYGNVVPFHILAVRKLLDSLVHIRVE